MKNKFNLGLIAEIKEDSNHPSSPVKSKDWKYFFDFFRGNGDVALFDWKSVDENFNVNEYLVGNKDSFEVVKGQEDIRNLCDIVYIGQLGKIHQNKNKFMTFLDTLENFPGQVVNPIETIKGNLSKGYLLELQDKGISVIPTLDVDKAYSLNDLRNMEFPNWSKSIDDLVLKPKVFGEQGSGVIRLSEIADQKELNNYLKANGETIAQPLINDIYTRGENSFIFTGREFSHGLNKITGNFKINLCESSKYSPRLPTKKEMDLCQSVFDVWPTNFGYVRMDIIPSENPLIGEVEMVNPAGYLSEVNAFEKYSTNLNKRLNEVYEGKWK